MVQERIQNHSLEDLKTLDDLFCRFGKPALDNAPNSRHEGSGDKADAHAGYLRGKVMKHDSSYFSPAVPGAAFTFS